MTKHRKSATIVKPMIDEDAALRFASAGSVRRSQPAAPMKSHDNLAKGMRQISLTVSEDLYDRIAKEAARKDRTVEEHLQKHLAKRYKK